MADISELLEELSRTGAKSVVLQFPEGLKRQALEYSRELTKKGYSVLISGDPCYGACDLALDLVGPADVLVHIGHSRLGDPKNVIFLSYSMDFPLEALTDALPLLEGPVVGVVTTVQHVHMVPAIISYLGDLGIRALSEPGGARAPSRGQVLGCSYESARKVAAHEILYVGTGLFHPTGVALATGKKVIALDPYQREASIVDVSKMVRQRSAVLAKAGRARSFGILVSSKSGQNRMKLAQDLALLGDDVHIVVIREITPDALLNLGFDAYVNTACPRIAYDDQERFPRPVLSPPEFEVLMGSRDGAELLIDEMVE